LLSSSFSALTLLVESFDP